MPNPQQWKMMPLDALNAGPVVPVIVIKKIEQAVPLAQALLKGGIRVLEVTLRSAAAVFAISPGLTPRLLDAANQGPIALIPGIASASELMLGMEMGYTVFNSFQPRRPAVCPC
ncbi:MAG: hypothetical protein PVG19_11905 [Desulfobacterales bacterium]|jgi:2-dehydro-3-deoxyphosphogluconate aldolase/(4S)-4-hydroxy-2-oxoglutarate aldolase